LEETINPTFRFNDSLSGKLEVKAESFSLSVTHLKQNVNPTDYKREIEKN